MAKDNEFDSPATEKQVFKSPSEKLPIKSYPETTKMATQGKKTTIEGPCDDCSKGYGK